jgi:hypothetical protein
MNSIQRVIIAECHGLAYTRCCCPSETGRLTQLASSPMFAVPGGGFDVLIIRPNSWSVHVMARRNDLSATESVRGGAVNPEGGYRTALGGVEQDPGDRVIATDADQSELVGGSTAEVSSNGRGDGSEFYDALAVNLVKLREPWGAYDDSARRHFPKLMAALTDRQTPRGKTREVARVSLAATKTGFRATLTDYLLSMKLTVDFVNLCDMPQALEQGINGNRGFWTEVKSGEGYQKRKEDEKKKLATSDGPV